MFFFIETKINKITYLRQTYFLLNEPIANSPVYASVFSVLVGNVFSDGGRLPGNAIHVVGFLQKHGYWFFGFNVQFFGCVSESERGICKKASNNGSMFQNNGIMFPNNGSMFPNNGSMFPNNGLMFTNNGRKPSFNHTFNN